MTHGVKVVFSIDRLRYIRWVSQVADAFAFGQSQFKVIISGKTKPAAKTGNCGFRYTAAFRQGGDRHILCAGCIGKNVVCQLFPGTGQRVILLCNRIQYIFSQKNRLLVYIQNLLHYNTIWFLTQGKFQKLFKIDDKNLHFNEYNFKIRHKWYSFCLIGKGKSKIILCTLHKKTSNFHVNEILKIIFRNSMIDITISIENACAKRRMLLWKKCWPPYWQQRWLSLL